MKIEQTIWVQERGWQPHQPGQSGLPAQLVFAFGSKTTFCQKPLLQMLKRAYPDAVLFGCTTAGEISGTRVYDHSLAVTAVYFERTKIQCVHEQIDD